MKIGIKFFAAFVAVFCAFDVMGQASASESAWVSLDKPALSEVVKSIVTDDYSKALLLEEWGFMDSNGGMTNAHPWADKNQVWILLPDGMIHLNTDDGNCLYEAEVNGDTVFIGNQSKFSEAMTEPTDPDYKGWIRLLSLRKDGAKVEYLTVDNLGVYRIFTPIPFSVDRMFE